MLPKNMRKNPPKANKTSQPCERSTFPAFWGPSHQIWASRRSLWRHPFPHPTSSSISSRPIRKSESEWGLFLQECYYKVFTVQANRNFFFQYIKANSSCFREKWAELKKRGATSIAINPHSLPRRNSGWVSYRRCGWNHPTCWWAASTESARCRRRSLLNFRNYAIPRITVASKCFLQLPPLMRFLMISVFFAFVFSLPISTHSPMNWKFEGITVDPCSNSENYCNF